MHIFQSKSNNIVGVPLHKIKRNIPDYLALTLTSVHKRISARFDEEINNIPTDRLHEIKIWDAVGLDAENRKVHNVISP